MSGRDVFISILIGAVTALMSVGIDFQDLRGFFRNDGELLLTDYMPLEEAGWEDREYLFREETGTENGGTSNTKKEEKRENPNVPKAFLGTKKTGTILPENIVEIASEKGDFYLKVAPVTIQEYREFDPEGRGFPSEGRDDRPAVFVTWREAKEYCEYWGSTFDPPLSGRLPMPYEWQIGAIAGRKHAVFGTETGGLSRQTANYGQEECCQPDGADGHLYSSPVRAFPDNPFGLFGMAGNVYEWTEPERHSGDFPPEYQYIFGGSWNAPGAYSSVLSAWQKNPGKGYKDVGFRCAAGSIHAPLKTNK